MSWIGGCNKTSIRAREQVRVRVRDASATSASSFALLAPSPFHLNLCFSLRPCVRVRVQDQQSLSTSDRLVPCLGCPSTNGNSSLIRAIAGVNSIPSVSILSALGGRVVHRGRGSVICRRFGGSRDSGDACRSPIQIVDPWSDVIDDVD